MMDACVNSVYDRKLFMQSSMCKLYDGGADFGYCRTYGTVGRMTPSPPGGASFEEPRELTNKTEEYRSRNYETDTTANNNVSANEHLTLWLNQQACGGTIKRKRRITRRQRVAANHRERNRMVHVNDAFEQLRRKIPMFPYEKKLSRIQTLHHATDYIALMTRILNDDDRKNKNLALGHETVTETTTTTTTVHYW
ncbi:hypothetical protein LSAT2_017932 [Lamellibrachia satsuma]|nr:hypothetical protein LSAT2_017932 [Lamellibrachia satsuma]